MVSHILKRELNCECITWAESRCLGIVFICFYLSKQSTETESDSDTTHRQESPQGLLVGWFCSCTGHTQVI